MEFLNNHIEITKKEINKIEDYIKKHLLEMLSESRNFEYAISELNKKIYSEIFTKNMIEKYSIHFGGILNYFLKTQKSYLTSCPDKKFETLRNEIYKKYNSFNLKKYSNQTYEDDFDFITFETFVKELLRIEVCDEIIRALDTNLDPLKKIYDPKKVEKFNLEKFLNKKQNNKKSATEENIHLVKESLKQNNLNENEQAFLFFIFCKILNEPKNEKGEFGIPMTEIVRLKMLINLYDKNAFIERHGDTLLYQYLSKGFDMINENEIEFFINLLSEKLQKLKLKKTVIKIKNYRVDYINAKKFKKSNKKTA